MSLGKANGSGGHSFDGGSINLVLFNMEITLVNGKLLTMLHTMFDG
jgi:hypothetical protein